MKARLTLRATHLGEYLGRPPTGKTVTVTGISIFQFVPASELKLRRKSFPSLTTAVIRNANGGATTALV